MKKRVFLLLAGLVLCALHAVYAEDAAQLITAVGNPINPTAIEVLFVKSSAEAAAVLPGTYPCAAGPRRGYACPVEWDTLHMDASARGLVEVPGRLVPGSGYKLADGLSDAVTYPVYIAGANAAPVQLSGVLFDEMEAPVAAVGSSVADFGVSSLTAYCLTGTKGEYFTCPISWDAHAVDFAHPGTYRIYGTPTLPAGFVLPASFTPIELTVGIVAADKIDLSAVIDSGSQGMVVCKWLYTGAPRASVSLEYAVGSGPWTPDPGQNGTWLYAGYGIWNDTLSIDLSALDMDKTYYFRLLYDGGKASNAVQVRRTAASVQTVGGFSGDRDGGDHKPGSLPEFVQPAPSSSSSSAVPSSSAASSSSAAASSSAASSSKAAASSNAAVSSGAAPLPSASAPDSSAGAPLVPAAARAPAAPSQSASSAASVPSERVSDSATVLSGLRLRVLTAQEGDFVLFEKHGVRVEIPDAFLESLGLRDDQLLSVTISHPAGDVFALALSVDSTAVTAPCDMLVCLPWTGESAGLACFDASGAFVSEAAPDGPDGTLTCTVRGSGTYRIAAAPGQSAAPAAVSASSEINPRGTGAGFSVHRTALLLLLGGAAMLCCGGGIWVIWRFRHV